MDSDGSQESTIAQGAGFILVGTVLSTAVGFLIRTFLIRHLSPAKYGLFALTLTVAGLAATIGMLGLRQGVTRFVSRCQSESEIRDVTMTAITSSVALSLLLSGLLVVFSDSIASHLLREAGLAPFLQVAAALVPAMSIESIAVATFRGKKRVYERIVLKNLVSPAARLLLVAGAILLGYGAFGAITAWTIGVGLSAVLGLYYLYCRTTTFELAPFTPRYRTLLAFSLPLMVSSAMWTAVQQADNLLLGYYKTSPKVGIYDGAFLLARFLLIVLGSFGFLFMPVFSELEAAGKREQMQNVYNSITEWAVLLVLPLYAVMVLVPEAVLTSIFKDAYSLGRISLILVASGFFVHVLSGSCGDALIALGRTRLVMAGNVGAGVLNVLLNIVLIPRFGITGAAAASAGSYALFNLFYLFWLHRETGIFPFSRHFLKPLLVSAVIITGVWTAVTTVDQLGLFSLVSVLVVTYLLHAVTVAKTKRMTPGDEQLLSKLEATLGIEIWNITGLFR